MRKNLEPQETAVLIDLSRTHAGHQPRAEHSEPMPSISDEGIKMDSRPTAPPPVLVGGLAQKKQSAAEAKAERDLTVQFCQLTLTTTGCLG